MFTSIRVAGSLEVGVFQDFCCDTEKTQLPCAITVLQSYLNYTLYTLFLFHIRNTVNMPQHPIVAFGLGLL